MKYAKFAFLFFILALSMTSVGCNYAQEGSVNLYTQWGNIKQVYKPEDGWYTEILPGQASYVINTKSFTEKAVAKVTSKDNAALQVEVSVTMRLTPEKASEYAKKYGFDETERHKRRNEILAGLIQTESRNAFSEHNAYDIYAQQESIQKRIIEAVKPQIGTQLLLDVESVQMGNPDFLDDRIEQAASAVVANEKQKQAEEAKLNAAEVAAKTKQIEAQTFANPALLQIRKLELELEIERARADGIKGHNGPLTIVFGDSKSSQLQLQSPTR